jgi:hypothetical protein
MKPAHRARIVDVTAMAGLLLLIPGCCCPCKPKAPTAPAGAASAGLASLSFHEEFRKPDSLDLRNMRTPGFGFYLARPFGWPATEASCVTVTGGVLTIRNPVNRAQFDLVSAVSDGQGGWHGFAPAGPAYFEAAIAFDPADASKEDKYGFPAFWTLSAEHLFDTLATRKVNPYEYLEIDFMEWNSPAWHRMNEYICCIHTYQRSVSSQGETKSEFKTHPEPYRHETCGRVISVPDGTDWRQFHVYGVLWIPGDRIETYFDNKLVRTVSLKDHPEIGAGNDQHFPVILGSGKFPMRVDWVRVWTP